MDTIGGVIDMANITTDIIRSDQSRVALAIEYTHEDKQQAVHQTREDARQTSTELVGAVEEHRNQHNLSGRSHSTTIDQLHFCEDNF